MTLKRKDPVQLITDPFHVIGRVVNARARGKRAEVKWPGKKRPRVHRKEFLKKVVSVKVVGRE